MIGILGGAFNPIHVGHLTLAEEARAQLGLERVILLPSGNPPHKGIGTSFTHRLNMCKIARVGNPNIVVSNIEGAIQKEKGLTVTIDVLRALETTKETHCFIMGGDSAVSFMTWDHPRDICDIATLAYCERPRGRHNPLVSPGSEQDWEKLFEGEFPDNAEIKRFTVPGLQISSTAVRQAMQTGDAWRYLVTENVYQYIKRHNLYQKEST